MVSTTVYIWGIMLGTWDMESGLFTYKGGVFVEILGSVSENVL